MQGTENGKSYHSVMEIHILLIDFLQIIFQCRLAESPKHNHCNSEMSAWLSSFITQINFALPPSSCECLQVLIELGHKTFIGLRT